MSSAIRVEGLVKRYGDFTAVDGISFTVEAGEVFGILGPNGAGKTTTLEILEGLQRPTQGQAWVLGMETQRHPAQVKERIGVQLQAAAYFDHLTLLEILHLFGTFYRRSLPPQGLLATVDLGDKAQSPLKKLSGGQKQRFTLAACLVNDPEVVILDEPTTGLDPQARHDIWDLVRQINETGKTVVLTTHYMEEASVLCHRVAIMDQGRILALDSPASLVRGLGSRYRITVEASQPLPLSVLGDGALGPQDIKVMDGNRYQFRLLEPAGPVQALLRYASNQEIQLHQLEIQPATLEDVFLDLTGRRLEG